MRSGCVILCKLLVGARLIRMQNSGRTIFSQYIPEITHYAKARGMQLMFGHDFEVFREIAASQSKRHNINPAFNPAHADLASDNALWLVGLDSSGELVHTQAIKLLALKGHSLETYFGSSLSEFRISGDEIASDRSRWFLTPQASRIAGRVTYHGELWLMGGPNGYRGGCLATLLTRVLLMQACLRLVPDFLIGFQSPMTCCRGLSIKEGYMRTEQRTILMARKNSQEFIEGWLVWMTREEAEFNLRIPPSFFIELFDAPVSPEKQKLSA